MEMLIKKIYGKEYSNLILSKNIVEVDVNDSGYHVIYNRLLNTPLILDHEGLGYIHNNMVMKLADGESYKTKEFLEQLISSYIYIPNELCEKKLIERGKKRHLKSFSEGKYINMLDLRISEECNFGCKHCIAGKAMTGAIMSFDTAKSIIDTYISFKERMDSSFDTLNIHFGIAEPLLNYKVIKDVIAYINSRYSYLNTIFSLNTNLSLLTKDMAAYFRNNKVNLHVSIDGLERCNDLIRISKDGKGTFSLINEKMKILEDVDYKIHDIGVTLTDGNFDLFYKEQDEFIGWCKNKEIKEVACEFDLINSMHISTEKKVEFLNSFIDKMAEDNIDFDGTWSIPHRNLVNGTYSETAFAFCRGASGANISVDRNYDIYICSCSSEHICSLSDLDKEVQEGGKFYNFVNEHLMGNKLLCKGCALEGCCVGQCNVTNEYNKPHKFKEQCDFYIAMTNEMLKRDVKHMLNR